MTIFSIVVYLITKLRPPLSPPTRLTHPHVADLLFPRPTCLHRIPRKPGRASRLNSNDEALDTQVRAEVEDQRVCLDQSAG